MHSNACSIGRTVKASSMGRLGATTLLLLFLCAERVFSQLERSDDSERSDDGEYRAGFRLQVGRFVARCL